MWVAVSSKGTVVKINTDTGEILGEYRTAPEGQPLNPLGQQLTMKEMYGWQTGMEIVWLNKTCVC